MVKRLLLALLLGLLVACGKSDAPPPTPAPEPAVDPRDPNVLCEAVVKNSTRYALASKDPGIRKTAERASQDEIRRGCLENVAAKPAYFECIRDAVDFDAALDCRNIGRAEPLEEIGDLNNVPSCKAMLKNFQACTAAMKPEQRDAVRRDIDAALGTYQRMDKVTADSACMNVNATSQELKALCPEVVWEGAADQAQEKDLCEAAIQNLHKLASASTEPGAANIASPRTLDNMRKECLVKARKDRAPYECMRDLQRLDGFAACMRNGEAVGDLDKVPSCKALMKGFDACVAATAAAEREALRAEFDARLNNIRQFDQALATRACAKLSAHAADNKLASCPDVVWERVPAGE